MTIKNGVNSSFFGDIAFSVSHSAASAASAAVTCYRATDGLYLPFGVSAIVNQIMLLFYCLWNICVFLL